MVRRAATVLAFAWSLAALATAESTPPFPPLPKAASSFGAARAGDYIYVYGGHSGKAHTYSTETALGSFHRIPIAGGTKWEELPGGPGLQGLNLVAIDGKVYRIGGMGPRNAPGEKADLRSVATCAVYDPQAARWLPFPPMPAGRSSHDAVAVGGKIVAVGGWEMCGPDGESVWHDTALVCDARAKEPKWVSMPQPFKRRALAVAAVGTKVYAIGGLNERGESVRTVNAFDAATGQWTLAPDLPGTERAGFNPAACECGGKVVANTLDRGVYALAVRGDRWEKVGETATARYVHRLVPRSPKEVVAVGGASAKGPLATVEVVDLAAAKAPAVEPAAGAAKAQKFCPVMTTDPVTPEDALSVEYRGLTVLLCCGTCVAKFRRDPAAYLDPIILPALAGAELPARKLEQVYCPVYRDRKVSAEDPFVTYGGAKVYVFNQTAKLRFEKDPKRYADPVLLPQLK